MRHRHSLIKLITVISLFFVGSSTVVQVAAPTEVKASTVSKKRNAIAKLAKMQVGKSYVYGATGPYAFDCSGLVQYIYRKAGKKVLPRTTYSQVLVGKRVSMDKLKKGDLLFWGPASAPYHVGVCVGHNKFVHAATPDQGVKEQTISPYFYPSAAKRILE
ncbi:C40 family peptidase [Lactobacillus sp. ESL0785]|uniref:C40 family peptidase n=1 Tax=Lactobacillus sp. ESL0785 TaxID=2983232 RepID=UPI0023F9E214|nr:C40 family peptidase [Lactobacillus sp. ESL0785]WEV70678.1 C40 family peptidase [Lactobacillus sp. ESL0785]